MAKKAQGMAARHATPKKSQRKSRQVIRPGQRFEADAYTQPVEETPRPLAVERSTVARPSAVRSRVRSAVHSTPTDYRYVTADLKKIAIIAGVLVAIMIALSFVVK